MSLLLPGGRASGQCPLPSSAMRQFVGIAGIKAMRGKRLMLSGPKATSAPPVAVRGSPTRLDPQAEVIAGGVSEVLFDAEVEGEPHRPAD